MKLSDLKEGDVIIIDGQNNKRKVYKYLGNNEYKGLLYLSIDMFDNQKGNFLHKMYTGTRFRINGPYLSNQGTEINV